jgi:hypothetical protein
MKKLRRLGMGVGLACALVSGTGHATEFTALKSIEAATPMQAEEMARVQGRWDPYIYAFGASQVLLYDYNLRRLNQVKPLTTRPQTIKSGPGACGPGGVLCKPSG